MARSDSKSDYIGRISNGGTQVIKAPNQIKGKKGKSNVKNGTDLRTGK